MWTCWFAYERSTCRPALFGSQETAEPWEGQSLQGQQDLRCQNIRNMVNRGWKQQKYLRGYSVTRGEEMEINDRVWVYFRRIADRL